MKYINEVMKSYAYSHMDGTESRAGKERISRKTESTAHEIEASVVRTKKKKKNLYLFYIVNRL